MNHTLQPDETYRDRHEAGEILAAHVRGEIGVPDNVLVLALPRGGVPVGFEVALQLDAELDVFVVRKLGAPKHKELAMGAVASGGVVLLNEEVVARLGITEREIAAVSKQEARELDRREKLYRGDRPPPLVEDRVVILVDDGLATGFTMRAAAAALQKSPLKRLVIAAPVGARETCARIRREVGTLICPLQPEPFHAVGLWYQGFMATTDEEVCAYLAATREAKGGAGVATKNAKDTKK